MDPPPIPSAADIVAAMMAHDAFSKWLGIEVVGLRPGYAKLQLVVKDDMLNGFSIAHGGICYSLADSALAFAANGHGRIALSTHTSMAYFEKVNRGDTLTAETIEVGRGDKNANYRVVVSNQNETVVASFEGTVYLTSKPWIIK
jgi:acyl-CoA thioesterase